MDQLTGTIYDIVNKITDVDINNNSYLFWIFYSYFTNNIRKNNLDEFKNNFLDKVSKIKEFKI